MKSTQLVAAAAWGMEANFAVRWSCAKVTPPDALIACIPIEPSVPGYLASLLTEAETSGGLLFSVAAEPARTVVDAFRRRGEECWEIGIVLPEPLIRINA